MQEIGWLIPAGTRNQCVGDPPGWGAVWMERGCSELEGTLTAQLQQVVNYLRAMEIRCVL